MAKHTLLEKIFLLDIKKGLETTFKHLFKSTVTLQYPRDRWTTYPRFRGVMRLKVDDQGKEICNACTLCAKACPINIIKIEAEGKGKERHPVVYEVDLSRCMFCNLCAEACPVNALELSEHYELSGYSREEVILTKKDMYKKRTYRKFKK